MIFATTKHSSTFVDWICFNLHSIFAVIDNYATATVLNNRELFSKDLRRVTRISIVAVSGDDNYHLTHKGTATLSWKDDDSTICDIEIKDALYFLISLVNIVSVSKLSLKYGDSMIVRDRVTQIKTTHGILWFSWDKEKSHRAILYPSSDLPEITINERMLESKQVSLFT